MNILQILPALNNGGVERGTLEIDKAIIGENWKSFIISSGGRMTADLCGIHFTLNVKTKNPFIMIRNIWKIKNIIRKYNIDIIHARSRAPAWSAYFAAKMTRIVFITTFHGVYTNNNFLKKIYNSIMLKSDHIIAVSNFVKNHIIANYNIDETKISVIYRGVDLNYFSNEYVNPQKLEELKNKLGIINDFKIIILPARITSWKGQKTLINAALNLKNENYKFFLIGEVNNINYLNLLKKQIEEFGLENNVKIFPAQSNMRELLTLADLIVAPSTRPEAFGRIPAEAQAMEKKIIATNIGGACETIQNNLTGWLISPNSSGELAEKIKYALNLNESESNKITRNAKNNIIENFSLEIMQKKTLDIYRKYYNLYKIKGNL